MVKADVTILGGGPGGIAASLRARQYGFKTILVEKDAVGGVCLHRGCIPTKSLITDVLSLTADASAEEKKTFFAVMLRKKENIVSRMHQGALSVLRKEGVLLMRGEGRITQEHRVRVNEEEITTKFILIATGSRPKSLPGLSFDGKRILSSDDLLRFEELPKSLLVIGAGATGCEFASLFHLLGTQVTLLEETSFILPGHDEELSLALKKIFVRQGIDVKTGKKVSTIEEGTQAAKVLLSVGRTPNSPFGLDALNLSLKNDYILVDRHMRTSVPSVFAIGDVVGKWPLAHVASHQGRVAVDNIAGKNALAEERAIPECVFTKPEFASVGWTEREARNKGRALLVGRSPFLLSAKAQILEQKEGFVKLIGDAQTGELLGAHLLGPHVTELVGELTLALRMGVSISDIQGTIHPHPTLSETLEEAARDFVQKSGNDDDNALSNVAAKAD